MAVDGVRPVGAREWWRVIEPVHAVTYFASEAAEALATTGLRGFWMGYFASRAAPLGVVAPEVVEAAFFNFHPSMVRRALPGAWALADRSAILSARRSGAVRALRRVAPGVEAGAEALVTLLGQVVEAADGAGRPLFSANRGLGGIDDPVEALWQLCTSMREHRGDGHVAALTAAALTGCEALALFAAAEGLPRSLFLRSRGWSEVEWDEAENRLAERHLLAGGRPTLEGLSLRSAVEEATDRLAAPPFAELDETQSATLWAGLRSLSQAVVAAGVIPFPNPMGFPAPVPTDG
jgi:hypothetical protein